MRLPFASMMRALLRSAPSKVSPGSIHSGSTLIVFVSPSASRRTASFTFSPFLPRNEPTGVKGLPSAETISSPASSPARAAGRSGKTAVTNVLPSITLVNMPTPE